MSAAHNTACILLAAGRSERFGEANKLLASFKGKPLARHAAQTLSEIPFARHIAICGEATASCFHSPFEFVLNDAPVLGMSHSIKLGVRAAEATGAQAVLIALADMPLIPAAHFLSLLDTFHCDASIDLVATSNAGRAQVPAIFNMEKAVELEQLQGDEGARMMLRNAPCVACDPALLADFDRPEDLAQFAE